MSKCHFFLSLKAPPTRASLLEPLCRPLYASKELNKGKESKPKRVSNPCLVRFLTLLLHPPQFCHQVKATSPSLQSFANLPPPPRDASTEPRQGKEQQNAFLQLVLFVF